MRPADESPLADELLRALLPLDDETWLAAISERVGAWTQSGVTLPRLPPDDLQILFNGLGGEANMRAGFDIYRCVRDNVSRWGQGLPRNARLLDFGCGWGRVARFFLRDVLADGIHGVDVSPLGIDACRSTLPYGTYSLIDPQPPLVYVSESFDVIYAYSVFSHLPERLHLDWVVELSRLLKPGGLFIATTLQRSFIDVCRGFRETEKCTEEWQEAAARSFVDADSARADYEAGRYLFSPLPRPDYGLTTVSRAYVERKWCPMLEYCDFIGGEHLPQAFIVMRKPGVSLPS